MLTRDRVTGLMSLVLGIATAIATSMLPASKMTGDIGPKVFPYIAAGILIICGLGLLITGSKKPAPYFNKAELKRLLLVCTVVVLYVVTMDLFGFVLPSIAVLYILSAMFMGEKVIPWWQRAIFSIAIALILYYSFTSLLGMKLPSSKFF